MLKKINKNIRSKYLFVSSNLKKVANILADRMLNIFLFTFVFFIAYLIVFDTFFLIKKYDIKLVQDSYLSDQEVAKIVNQLRFNRFLGVIPQNNYWFINEASIEKQVEKISSKVESIDIVGKKWPSGVLIEIKTKDINNTIAINSNSGYNYYRVNESGVVVTDEDNLRSKVITIGSGVELLDKEDVSVVRSLISNSDAANKIAFSNYLLDTINSYEDVSDVGMRSLVKDDKDVIINLEKGPALIFNLDTYDSKILLSVIDKFFQDEFMASLIDSGDVNYFDFRVDGKVSWCKNDTVCSRF